MSSNKNIGFIKLDLFKVSQVSDGFVFAGKIKFKDLLIIPKYTERTSLEMDDPFTEEDSNQHSFFQRRIDPKRIKKIKNFLEKNLSGDSISSPRNIFPSSIILYNQIHENNEGLSPENFDPKISNGCFFHKKYKEDQESDIYTLYIPEQKEIALIVDGQHRIFATKELYEERSFGSLNFDRNIVTKIENLEFIVTYLIGYDIIWPSKVFIDVNFNQKPVNRSLYYDIFGSYPPQKGDRDDNILILSHDLCRHLNENEQSPIQNMVNMLGNGQGLITQGFLVDAFRKIFRKIGFWTECAINYNRKDMQYIILADFMKAYLSAIRKCYYSSWPDKNKPYTAKEYDYSILCKTTGMGAFLRLIIDIFPRVYDKPDMEEEIIKILKRISEADAKELFKAKEPDDSAARFAGAGALGLQNALYKELFKRYGLNKEESHQSTLFEKNS